MSSNVENDQFVELWLRYATLLRSKDPEESRDAYEYMVRSRMGLDVASLWITWAELEFTQGKDQTAEQLLSKGFTCNAMPHSALIQAQQRLNREGLREFRHQVEMPYRHHTAETVHTPLMNRTNRPRRVQHDPDVKKHAMQEQSQSPAPIHVHKSVAQTAGQLQGTWHGPPASDGGATSSPCSAAHAQQSTPQHAHTPPPPNPVMVTLASPLAPATPIRMAPQQHPLVTPTMERVAQLHPEKQNATEMEINHSRPTQHISSPHPQPAFQQPSPYQPPVPVVETPQAQRTHNSPLIPLTPVTLPNVCTTVNNVQYAVFQEIGRGGSSKVVKAFSPNYQILAIKTVTYHDKREFSLYMKEVESLQRFQNHPHIIQMLDYEVDESEGLIKMVLELGEIDLHKLLVQHRKQCGTHWKPLSENTLRHYWQQMLEAVDAIHEEGVIHTDLKPANFLMVQGKLKLIDFGIADHLEDDCTSIERDCALGTPSYLSPEACTAGPRQTWEGNRCKVGRPADVWSLGIILYQLVYGVTPFCKLGRYHKMLAIPDPKYPIDWYTTRNTDLLEVMQHCLQRDPKARPTIPELLRHPFLHPSAASMVN